MSVSLTSIFKLILFIAFIVFIVFIFGVIRDLHWNFQKISILIAIFIFICCLVVIGTTISSASKVYPPDIPNCPDYFTDVTSQYIDTSTITSTTGSYCYNNFNLGTYGPNTMNFTTSDYTGSSGTCNKYTWANTYGLTWDGITTAYSSPCTTSTSSTSTSTSTTTTST